MLGGPKTRLCPRETIIRQRDGKQAADTCVARAGRGCGRARRLPQHQADSLGVGFALVVRLGHDGGGEEHITQGAALVPVHLCLRAVLR